jgi:hypothetical protein
LFGGSTVRIFTYYIALDYVDKFVDWQNTGDKAAFGRSRDINNPSGANLATLLQCLYHLEKLPEAFDVS